MIKHKSALKLMNDAFLFKITKCLISVFNTIVLIHCYCEYDNKQNLDFSLGKKCKTSVTINLQ